MDLHIKSIWTSEAERIPRVDNFELYVSVQRVAAGGKLTSSPRGRRCSAPINHTESSIGGLQEETLIAIQRMKKKPQRLLIRLNI